MTGPRQFLARFAPIPPFGSASRLTLAAAVTATAATALSAGLAGCGAMNLRNLSEQRAVRRFGDALTAESLAQLSEATTPEFRTAALDHDAALDDLRLLRLPKEELKVVSVADVPEKDWKNPDRPEALVIVETPPPVRDARFRLVRAEPGKWLVDDVLLKQNKRNVTAVVSVTEQLELLAAVRGFTEVWADGSREARLAAIAPELRTELAALPPERLDELAGWTVNGKKLKSVAPEAQMDDDSAAVRFMGRGYQLLVSLSKDPEKAGPGGQWKVTDVAAETRDGGPVVPSLKRACVAMNGISTFLDAYAAGDKDRLKTVTAPRLYSNSLADADLAAVPLPTAADLGGDSEFRIDGDTAEVVFNTDGGVVTVVLTDPHRHDADRSTGAFLVDDVTLRGIDGEQKMLSTVFTARSAVRRFAAAAAATDLDGLRSASTRDLTERVWGAADAADLPALPLAIAATGADGAILAERYAGSVTEITFDGPSGPRTFVLKDEDGAARVDDVLAPSFELPESFKRTCELILPARSFARTLAAADLPGLHRRSSAAFNRLVWHQLRTVPPAAQASASFLDRPLSAATPLDRGEGARCELTFGSPTDGAVLHLVRQGGVLAVDDVVLTAGVRPDQRVALKQALRARMAEGTLMAATTLLPTAPGAAEPPRPMPMSDAAVTAAAFAGPAGDGPGRPSGDAKSAAAAIRSAVRTAAFETPADPDPAPTGSRRKTKEERRAARAAKAAENAADAPPPFDAGVIVPAPLAADPVPGCDDGSCAPFGGPLPLD